MSRRPRRLGATTLMVVAFVAALVLGGAQPASAHATLIGTDPGEGAVLPSAPDEIVFTFDEAVRSVPGGVQVFDARGGLIEASSTTSGTDLVVTPSQSLGEGTTVIVWRAVSDDGHPLSGALTFSVGAVTTDFTPPATEPAGTPDVPRTLTILRWLGYLGLFLSAGLVVFALLVLPAAQGVPDALSGGTRRRLTSGLRIAAGVAAIASLATLPVNAVYLLGGGFDLLARASTWSSLPPREYAVAIAVAVGLALAVVALGRGLPSRRRRMVALGGAVIALSAPALTGHTRSASPQALVVLADVLHLLAGSVWLGGLVGLTLVLPDLAGRGTQAGEVLARFSTAAAGVLAALVAAGSLLAWRILGSWGALIDTDFGRLLLIKIGVVLVAIAIAAWNRWSLLPRLHRAVKAGERRAGTRAVVRATGVEGVVLVGVLILSSMLVDKSPEGDPAPVAAPATPGAGSVTLADVEVLATITPLTEGPNTVTVQLRTATGEPTEGVAPPVVRLSSGDLQLGAVRLEQAVAGTYTGKIVIPAAGPLQMQVSLRVSESADPLGELEFDVAAR